VTAASRDILVSVDRYFDAAPRADATDEAVGPFTLFRSRSVWSYYARPRRGLDGPVTAEDVALLAARCDELEIDLSIEWIGELTPSLEHAVAAAGLEVERHALLVLDAGELRPVAPPQDVAIELLAADGVLAAGSLQPAGDAAEILAVATLPSHRRRGVAAAVTTALLHEAERRAVAVTLLSTRDQAVTRVYERVGFRCVGTHLAAARDGD
jgi:ribosomal protein S18 acetylase RimI-like enzyme